MFPNVPPQLARRVLYVLVPLIVVVNLLYLYSSRPILDLLPTSESSSIWKLDGASEYYIFSSELTKSDKQLGNFAEKAKTLPVPHQEVKNELAKKLAESGSDYVKAIQREVEEEYKKKYEKEVEGSQTGHSRRAYFEQIINDIMYGCAPTTKEVEEKGTAIYGNMMHEVNRPLYSKKFLTRAKVGEEMYKDLQLSHDAAVKAIRQLPVPPSHVYSGTGIVISASKTHLLGAMNVVIQIRELGSKLPVEILLDTESAYDKHACDEVLPKLNAKCLVMERELGPTLYAKMKLVAFQLKAMAVILSSFDNTLILDADNFPIRNVDTLFESEPYLRTKFVLWPDIWHKGAAPLYYDIARFTPGEVVRRDGLANDGDFNAYISGNRDNDVLFHDLDGVPPFRSVESGQLLVSKTERMRSLLLSMYYNLHGPKLYYALLYQGTFGSGDRETFVPALHVMNEAYYLTEWEVIFSGVQREKVVEKGKFYFDESTMLQRDPAQALEFKHAWRRWLATKRLDVRLNPFQEGDYTRDLKKEFFEQNKHIHHPDVFFMHVNHPKVNAMVNELSEKSRYDYKTRSVKTLGQFEDILGPTDWELRFQTINAWSACHGLSAASWTAQGLDMAAVCKKSRDYVDVLKRDTNDAPAGKLTVVP